MFPLEAFGAFLESVMMAAIGSAQGTYRSTRNRSKIDILLLQDPDGHREVKLHESEVLH